MSVKFLVVAKPWGGILAGLLLIGLMWTGIATAQSSSQEEKQIRAVVERLVQGYLKKDMSALLAVASDDAELVVESPLGQARHKGREKIRAAYGPDLKALGSPTLSITNLEVKMRQGMAQAVAEVMAGGRWGQEQLVMPARLSILLEKAQGKWAVYYALVRYPLLRPEFEQLLGR